MRKRTLVRPAQKVTSSDNYKPRSRNLFQSLKTMRVDLNSVYADLKSAYKASISRDAHVRNLVSHSERQDFGLSISNVGQIRNESKDAKRIIHSR